MQTLGLGEWAERVQMHSKAMAKGRCIFFSYPDAMVLRPFLPSPMISFCSQQLLLISLYSRAQSWDDAISVH